ncbi:MAG: glycosyltransferase family 4 protein [Planctomycetaceae bacterium]|nr:glycosyltransferase family 4 protein [Planctomycetaceae bacterium]
MRVAINGLHLIPGRLGGLETYLHELLRDLATAKPPEHELVIYSSSKYASAFDAYRDSFQVIPIDVNVDQTVARIWFEQTRLSKFVQRDRIDILHSSGYTAPSMKACRTIMTVHDLCYLEIPEMIRHGQGTLRWLALRMLGPYSLKKSDRLITDTHHVAAQIKRRYGIQQSRIHTLHLKPMRDFSTTDIQPLALPALFSSGYLLYVGSWLPHKNHRLLLTALANARRHGLELPPLVLAGLHLNSDRQRDEFARAVATLNISDRVYACPNGLSVEQLAGLYRSAKLFVFPSLFEGFGYPVVEAMSAKTPVLCSNLEPMLEVSAGQAGTFDPHDPEDLLRAIQSLLNRPEDCRDLAEKGYRRYLELCEQTHNNGDSVFQIYEGMLRT